MNKLIKDTRIKKIIEPSTILDVYKELVNDYIKFLYLNFEIINNNNLYSILKIPYKNLIKECEEFINNDYTLDISFEDSCMIYNKLSESFEVFLILINYNNDEQHQIVSSQLMIHSVMMMMQTIFK